MNQAANVLRAKGPLIWLDMDQKALDDAYDQLVYAPNRDQVHKRNKFNSDRVRARLGEPKRIAYGPKPIEALDLFPTSKPNAPINVFIHGGAWRQRSVKDYAFLAEMFVRAGSHWIGLDFDGVEGTNGNLLPMADQVRRGVAFIYKNAKSFGGDPSRIYVSGQSSGAHLAGNVVTTDWEKDYGVPNDIVKGALLCSGMYDLKPVRLSKRSEYVAFTDEVEEKQPPDAYKGAVLLSGMYDLAPVRLSKRSSYVKFTDMMVEQLSAQRHLDGLHAPLVLAYGTCETPEFQRQSRDFAAAIKAKGKSVELIEGLAYNHFELLETLANPYGLTGRAMLRQMQLVAK